MTISIGLSQPKKPKLGSKLIKWWIKKPYSHAFLRYINPLNRDVVFHAAHGNVHQILWSNFEKENNIIKTFTIECTEYQYNLVIDFYFEKCGIEYSTKGIFYIFFHDLLWKFGICIKTIDDPGYICSELTATVLQNIFNIKFKKPFNLIRPDDIEERLINEKITQD